ncbi:hypothetical protein KDA14_05955, partial [Candidatus Saccharibacteria bacterium]|nr:hypothetical protein [Candidatus Saccharibacteria bacterium]
LEVQDLIAYIRNELGLPLKANYYDKSALEHITAVMKGKPDPVVKKYGAAITKALAKGSKLWNVFITNGHYDSDGFAFAPTKKDAIRLAKNNAPFDNEYDDEEDEESEFEVEVTPVSDWQARHISEIENMYASAKTKQLVFFDGYAS